MSAVGATTPTNYGAVTLYGVKYPYVASGSAASIKTAGKVFAVADLKVCPETSNSIDLDAFRLVSTDASTYTFWNVQIGAETPNLTKALDSPAAGVCSRGFLTYEVDPGKMLTQFVVANKAGDPAIWTLK